MTGRVLPDEYDIPWGDLAEVLRSWSGQGQLYEALAAVPDERTGLRWSRRDIERRAHRVMFEELRPYLEKWPRSKVQWLDTLPAQSHHARRIATAPAAGVDWTATRTLGWPPERFVLRERSRSADQLAVRTLRWVLDNVAEISRDAGALDRTVIKPVEIQLGTALTLREHPPLAGAESVAPGHLDIVALKHAGRPWNVVAPVAAYLRRAMASGLIDTARRHIAPVEELRWRLFHLAVFGGILRTLRDSGATLENLRPLSGRGSPRPNYVVKTSDGTVWDLWFEAAGIWGYYGWPSPYYGLTKSAFATASPLGADIALVRPNEAAVLFECKYGPRDYVARYGYLQIVTYCAEVSACVSGRVVGCIVGPNSIIDSRAATQVLGHTIEIASPAHMEDLCTKLMASVVGGANQPK